MRNLVNKKSMLSIISPRKTHTAKNVAQDFSEQQTMGQRLADKVAALGGSWTFISIFAVVSLFGFS